MSQSCNQKDSSCSERQEDGLTRNGNAGLKAGGLPWLHCPETARLMPRMLRAAFCLLLCLAWGPSPCRAQTAFVNFDATNQLTNVFFLWNNGGAPNNFSFAANPSDGANGSGADSVFQ